MKQWSLKSMKTLSSSTIDFTEKQSGDRESDHAQEGKDEFPSVPESNS